MTPESSRYGQKRVLTKVAVSPKRPIRMISMELVKAKSTVHDILKADHFHSYKLQILHQLTEDDPDRRMQMCEWFSSKLFVNDRFTEDFVLFRPCFILIERLIGTTSYIGPKSIPIV